MSTARIARRSLALQFAVAAVVAGADRGLGAQSGAPARPASMTTQVPARDGTHDFDFLHGAWRVHNRRLRQPLTGSEEWYEFDGRSVERPFWDGQGNLEEYEATLPDGTPLRGIALRLYDPKAQRWTIHWSNSANGTLDPPMTGAFRDGRGEFYSHEDYRGRMILVRFIWTSSGKDAARWEQAFSADAGRSWETNWIMEFTRAPADCCAVVELRQYGLHPGGRERLIHLFDERFIEPQEAVGMRIIAQFRDIDRPDVFTWLRGFPDMTTRREALVAFYGGPVWAAHRDSANATMVSSDNVRLLRPARTGSGFALPDERPPLGATVVPPGLVVATIYTLELAEADDFPEFFEREVVPRLGAAGSRPFAMFETEPTANNFPRLPVREGERAFVWFARYADRTEHDRALRSLAQDGQWKSETEPSLGRRLRGPVEIWRLTPTARSLTFR
jgi:hypothetical protein